MAEYDYKGFKIFYEITQSQKGEGLFQASGYVVCPGPEKTISLTQKFHTEYPTKAGVSKEIKKIIESYVDFEWKEFLEMQEQ